MMPRAWTALAILAVLVSGCSSTPDYACKAPDGTTCKSITEVYQETDGELRRKPIYSGDGSQENTITSYKPSLASERTVSLPKIKPGDPVRVEPRILRIWLAPWEDEDGVFYDQSYIYAIIDRGRWLVSQNRNLIENSWRARSLKPPKNLQRPAEEEQKDKPAPHQQPASAEQTDANRAAARAMEDASRYIGETR